MQWLTTTSSTSPRHWPCLKQRPQFASRAPEASYGQTSRTFSSVQLQAASKSLPKPACTTVNPQVVNVDIRKFVLIRFLTGLEHSRWMSIVEEWEWRTSLELETLDEGSCLEQNRFSQRTPVGPPRSGPCSASVGPRRRGPSILNPKPSWRCRIL